MCDSIPANELRLLENVSTGLNVGQSYLGALQDQKRAEFAAALARAREADALSRGESEAARRVGKGRRQASAIRTQTAARGLDVNEGTALRLEEDADLLAELDAQTIRDNAEKEASGFRSEAQQFDTLADSSDPLLAATGTLIGNVGRIARNRQRRKLEGSE